METGRGLVDTDVETPVERANRNGAELLQEFRVLQAGTQILTGFLLAMAFQPAFASLPGWARVVYLSMVLLATVSTIMALAPVAMHRAVFQHHEKAGLVSFGHTVMIITLSLVSVLIVTVAGFIFAIVVSEAAGVIVAVIIGIVVIAAWLIMPIVLRGRWQRGSP